jgi:cell division protein FtsL
MASSFIVAETVRRQHVAGKSILLRNRRIKFYCLVLFVILCSLLVYVWTRIKVVQQGYELSRLTKETDELVGQKSRLESEVATLKSPQRLEVIARDYFGMRLPHGDEIVLVEP